MAIMKNLWIDDIRVAPDGWMWAKTSQEAIAAIDANDTFT
jgi:hypothetical protein